MIRLEQFKVHDFSTLKSWIESPEALMQFAGPDYTFPLTIEQLSKSLNSKKIHPFKVIHQTTSLMIGYAEIYVTEQNTAWLGKILIGASNHRGKGIGQHIVRCLLEKCFLFFNVETVMLNVFDWNVSAIKCYERTGFTVATGITNTGVINGQTWTTLRMAIDKVSWKSSQ